MGSLPLEGMKVIEMGRIVAGPTAGMIPGEQALERLARKAIVRGEGLPPGDAA